MGTQGNSRARIRVNAREQFTRATSSRQRYRTERQQEEAEGKYELVLGVGLEGVERRLLARDSVVDEREAAGAGPPVGLLLPLRQFVPRLRATPPPATGVLPGRLPQKEGALLLPGALAAVGGALGTRDAHLIRRSLRGGDGGRGFALLRHKAAGGWKGGMGLALGWGFRPFGGGNRRDQTVKGPDDNF